MRVPFTFLVAVIMSVSACSRAQEFQLRGQVLAVDRGRMEMTVKHEDIRGFMPGMTMPFKVKDARAFESTAAGDLITATLVVLDNDAFLESVTKTGHAALTEPPPSVHRMDVLAHGNAVPDVALTDDAGTARTLSEWRGKVLAVTFVYTRCPIPDFCPRMDRHFAAAQRDILADPALRDRVALLSVSFDPDFDTPEVLAAHARQAGADPRVWRFATGDREAIATFASRFGVSVIREGADTRDLTHNLRTAIIGRDGRVVEILSGNEWTPAALLESLRRASA